MTGAICLYRKRAGTFARTGPATFDNFWAPLAMGPNGALYGANYGGVTMLRDAE